MTINKQELLSLLRDHLRIEIASASFTDPNSRTVNLVWINDGRYITKGAEEVIASASFDVVQVREYEG